MSVAVAAVLLSVEIFGYQKVEEQSSPTVQDNPEILSVYFLDVGQGDATYIQLPGGEDVLIDGGPDASVLVELGKVMWFWDQKIDYVILTHPHADHVTGLVEVLRRYAVKQIYYTGALHTAPAYLAWLAEIEKQKIPMQIVEGGFELDFGGARLEFMYPTENIVGKKFGELNNSSNVTRLVYGDSEFLLTGDAQEEVEKELLAAGVNLNADVLKVAHHGSSDATSEDFLSAVSPQFSVISSGRKNDFGHPHLRVLKRLERLGAKILRTDELGTIKIESDGRELIIK